MYIIDWTYWYPPHNFYKNVHVFEKLLKHIIWDWFKKKKKEFSDSDVIHFMQ